MLRSSLVPLNYSGSVDSQGQNVVTGFSLPLPNSDCGQIPIRPAEASSVEIWNVHSGTDAVRDYSVGTSYPLATNFQSPELFMEGIPISGAVALHAISVARYGTSEDQQKLTTLDSCAYPLEYPNSTVPNHSSNVASSSFETMNYGYEGSPFDRRTKWNFNKFTSQELFRRIVGRNGTENSASNGWVLSENTAGMDSSSPGASHSELCLSLSTCQRSVAPGTSIREHCSEMSSVTSYALHRKHVGSEQKSCSSNNPSLSFNSDKPLQLSLMSGSRFFQAMQEILAEIARYALLSYTSTCIGNGINVSFSSSCPSERGFSALDFSDGIDRGCGVISRNNLIQRGVEAKKRQLLALLQVVDDQYNHCLDEVHTVISAFHAVTQLDPNIHARFALPTIASMYKNLRERISCRILEISANFTECEPLQEKSFEMSLVQKQWALQQLRKRDPQLWRPQRGLPERSVSVLRAWMFQNFLHPYPKDTEKHLLALRSGLTRSQVSNWFINARVRLWKPMIEEMYAEMNGRKTHGTRTSHVLFENGRFTMN
ncbi:homeobox protein ATH1-like isoform X2 [Primulina huaijiensis]